jgi:hypothetical protein
MSFKPFGRSIPEVCAELEPVRQSGSGPAGRNRIFAGFLPDFCQFDVKNEPDGFYRIFFDFFARLFVRFLSV